MELHQTASASVRPSQSMSILCRRFEVIKQERIAKYQGMNLYVKNLTDEVDDAELRKEFEPFGTITSAKVGAGRRERKSWRACMSDQQGALAFSTCLREVWEQQYSAKAGA